MDDQLDRLNRNLRKQNSLFWSLLRGIFSGFGIFIGSAILVALLIYILRHFISIPVIGQWIADLLRAIHQQGGY